MSVMVRSMLAPNCIGLSGRTKHSSSPMVMFLQGDHGGLVTSDQEQQKWLDEASTSVKRNAFFMKKALVSLD